MLITEEPRPFNFQTHNNLSKCKTSPQRIDGYICVRQHSPFSHSYDTHAVLSDTLILSQRAAGRVKNYLEKEASKSDFPIKLQMLDVRAMDYNPDRKNRRLEPCISLKVKASRCDVTGSTLVGRSYRFTFVRVIFSYFRLLRAHYVLKSNMGPQRV